MKQRKCHSQNNAARSAVARSLESTIDIDDRGERSRFPYAAVGARGP